MHDILTECPDRFAQALAEKQLRAVDAGGTARIAFALAVLASRSRWQRAERVYSHPRISERVRELAANVSYRERALLSYGSRRDILTESDAKRSRAAEQPAAVARARHRCAQAVGPRNHTDQVRQLRL